MNRLVNKTLHKQQRKHRIRSTIYGTTERPRLSVTISLNHVSAQIIDDSKSTTLVASTTIGQKKATGSMTEKASSIGTDIAKKAKVAKINKVVFDRNGKLYHGRIKALADAARAEGLEF